MKEFDNTRGLWPVAHEKSVVLGGDMVLHPVEDPGKTAMILQSYTSEVWEAAFKAGQEQVRRAVRAGLDL